MWEFPTSFLSDFLGWNKRGKKLIRSLQWKNSGEVSFPLARTVSLHLYLTVGKLNILLSDSLLKEKEGRKMQTERILGIETTILILCQCFSPFSSPSTSVYKFLLHETHVGYSNFRQIYLGDSKFPVYQSRT